MDDNALQYPNAVTPIEDTVAGIVISRRPVLRKAWVLMLRSVVGKETPIIVDWFINREAAIVDTPVGMRRRPATLPPVTAVKRPSAPIVNVDAEAG